MPATRETISGQQRLRETILGLPRSQIAREYAHLCATVDELRATQEQLRAHQTLLEQENDQLRAPELYEAFFLEADGEYARVAFRGGNRLVRTAGEVAVASLHPGQIVYLNNETNVILAVSGSQAPVVGEVVPVDRVTPDGRLVVRSRGEDIVVRPGQKLAQMSPRPGDDVIVDRELRMAFEVIPRAQDTLVAEEIADTPPESLAGCDALRDGVLKRFTMALAHPELAGTYGVSANPSLLLAGPPGTGKTLLMRVIATVVTRISGRKCRVVTVKASQLEEEFVGATQRNIRNIFRNLRAGDGPRLLFIDEVEAIARRRGNIVGFHADRFLSSWLAEMDGMSRERGIAIIATTNRLDLLDNAFAERFDTKLRMERPRMQAAAQIFATHLRTTDPFAAAEGDVLPTREEMIQTGVAKFFAPNATNDIAVLKFRDGKPRTVTARELLSGRVIKQCCDAARHRAFVRAAEGGDAGMRVSDLEQAIDDKISELASLLTVGNVHHHLPDLPTDVDVVSVDRIPRKPPVSRYLVGALA